MLLGQGTAAAARRRLGRFLHGHGVAMRSDISQLRSEIEGSRRQVEGLNAAVHEVRAGIAAVAQQAEAVRDQNESRLRSLERLSSIEAVTRFIQHAHLSSTPLVSVVLPTYNRSEHLGRAIDSVLAQSYSHWELLVVDDGGQSESRAIVERAADPRIRWTQINHKGASGARNAALALAAGELIAYQDDDNVMDPGWLRAVVWAFAQCPDADVLYGAFVIDDLLRVRGEGSGDLPQAFLYDWNREHLKRGNLADIGAIAHRNGLPQGRFDENLREMGDWDLLLRLTADQDPLVLPAIACYYTSDAPHRLTNGPTHRADYARVAGRAAAANGGPVVR